MIGFGLTTLLLAIYFITPGVVALKARDLAVASPERNWGEKTLELISFGALNLFLYQLIVLPAINALYSLFHQPPALSVPALITSQSISFGSTIWLSFVLPGILGWLSGTIPQSYRFQRLSRGIIPHPQPTAWDFLFANRYKYYALIFHLKSGYKVAGLYQEGAFVSAFPQPKEIYLPKQCILGPKGEVLGVDEESSGVLILMEECTLMEVIPLPPAQKQIFVERKSQWQKITLKIAQLSSEFRKLRSANKRPSSARVIAPLVRQTPASSRLGEAESSPSPHQIPQVLERNPQPNLQLPPQLQIPTLREEPPQPLVLPAKEEVQPQLLPQQPVLVIREEPPSQLPPQAPALAAREELPQPPAPIPATKAEEPQ